MTAELILRRAVPLLLASLMLLGGCPRPPVSAPTPAKVPTMQTPDLAGAKVYVLVPDQSTVHIEVYRAGPMARLGHNHVISSLTAAGRAWLHADISRSGFDLSFPVSELVVDDRDARIAAGAEFPADVPDRDKEGTRNNMLRTEVLDAASYPTIRLWSAAVRGELPRPEITTFITIKDATREVMVPVEVEVNDDVLRARGEFAIRQTDFGITPFSVAMGAIQVRDELRIRFDLHAQIDG